MKGQFVFQFLIAGVIFFAIVLYGINYMNVNVSDFKNRFYQEKLQSKSFQISMSLMNSGSDIGFVDDEGYFDDARIDSFKTAYCSFEDYGKLLEKLHLYETAPFMNIPHNVNIRLSDASGDTVVDCGRDFLGLNITVRVEAERVGVFKANNEIGKLSVVVW